MKIYNLYFHLSFHLLSVTLTSLPPILSTSYFLSSFSFPSHTTQENTNKTHCTWIAIIRVYTPSQMVWDCEFDDDDGRSEQWRDAVPRGAGVEALRGALREHGAAGPVLLGVRFGRACLRSRPQGASGHAPSARVGGFRVAQCLARRGFQHPGSIRVSLSPICFFFLLFGTVDCSWVRENVMSFSSFLDGSDFNWIETVSKGSFVFI